MAKTFIRLYVGLSVGHTRLASDSCNRDKPHAMPCHAIYLGRTNKLRCMLSDFNLDGSKYEREA